MNAGSISFIHIAKVHGNPSCVRRTVTVLSVALLTPGHFPAPVGGVHKARCQQSPGLVVFMGR